MTAGVERLRRARVGCAARRRRSSLRDDCSALLGRVASSPTHFAHFVRCVQTCATKSDDEARCARGHTPCAARRLPGAAQRTRARLRKSGGSSSPKVHRWWLSRQAAPGRGDLGGGEERSFGAGARSALRNLTSERMFERSERSERSELARRLRARAAQSSRRAAATASVARRSAPGRAFAAQAMEGRAFTPPAQQ